MAIITKVALVLRDDAPTPGDTDVDEDPLALRAHRAKTPSSFGPLPPGSPMATKHLPAGRGGYLQEGTEHDRPGFS